MEEIKRRQEEPTNISEKFNNLVDAFKRDLKLKIVEVKIEFEVKIEIKYVRKKSDKIEAPIT